MKEQGIKKDLMRIERVPIDKVYPDEKNPRDDFGDLDKLAASFACTPDRPGEPVCPPVLVTAGSIYHIVDGERRYRAMKKLGTKSFQAIVCENFDDADIVMSMVSTDDKKELTDLEKSRGIQRMLFLGVEPKKVEKASGFKGANRVKTAMQVAGGHKARCMTLEQLLAIEEFKDDEDAAKRIIDAEYWQGVYHQEKFKKSQRIEERKLIDCLDKAGIKHYQDVETVKNFDYIEKRVYGIAAVQTYIDDTDESEFDNLIAIVDGLDCTFYSNVPREVDAAHEEQLKRNEEIEKKIQKIEKWVDGIYKFYVSCTMSSFSSISAVNLNTYFRDAFLQLRFYGGDSLSKKLDEWDVKPDLKGTATGHVAVKIAWMAGADFDFRAASFARRFLKNEEIELDSYDSDYIRSLLEMIDAALSDGYAPLEEELAVIWTGARMALKAYDRKEKEQEKSQEPEEINEVD